MPDKPSSNVRIYERPEHKGPSPIMLVIGLLLVLLTGFILYKFLYHPAANVNTATGFLPVSSVLWQAKGLV